MHQAVRNQEQRNGPGSYQAPTMQRGLIMGIIVQAIMTGILTGGVYALMASGLTLVFGVMDIINVGQGALVILGAYLSFFWSKSCTLIYLWDYSSLCP